MSRGGARVGAGRPKQEPTVCYHRRVKPEWVKILDNILNKLKTEAKMIKKSDFKIYLDKYCKDWEEKDPNIQYAASDGTNWFVSADSIIWTKAETML